MGYTMTAMGSRMLRKWILWPLLKHEDITLRHDAVEFLANNKGLRSRLRTLIASLGDLERLIGRTAWMRAEARDLLSLAQAILELPRLSAILAMMPVNKYFSGAATIPMPAVDLAKKVQNFIVSKLASRPKEGMLVKDGVDESLDSLRIQIAELESWMNNFAKQEQIRTGLSSLEVGYSRPLGRYISIKKGKLNDQSIPENYQKLQTLKNEERFVTSELLGNERKRLDVISKACEREEEILDMLREEMAKISKSLQYLCQAIAALDVLSTFAELAVQRNYVRPEIMESGSELTIVSGRHPVVELILAEQSMFIPNSTYLGFNPFEPMTNESSSDNLTESDSRSKEKDKKFWPRSDLILLTGPNSSGKSCYLRQVGLIQILAQAGSFVPAKRARMSIADAVFTQVGAVDDLSAGQSAFNVEMGESANILNCATSKSLVLLDEVGRGAGSHEGEAFARAIIEYLSQHIKARTIFSTYYHNLHHIDIEFPNISNYHFEAHETETGSIMFEYILKPGFALQSYTVALGRVAGLPEWVCNRAAELLTSKDDHSSTWGSDDPVTGLRNVGNFNEVACPDKAASINPKEPESMQMIGISNSNVSTAASNIADQAFNWRSWLRRKWKGVEKNGTISLAGQSSTIDDHVAGNFEHDAGLEISFSIEELKETWENVLKVLQNRPATLALANQKGSLLAISKFSDAIHVKLGASELFVKKFEQHEHAIAMEAAFKTVLKQPVKLQICTISTVED
ncbi:hypothetical protein O6H91_09G110800 [Diphasiastrum complanatum]|nr:hypothetical protein O6H91_09G110800 [Diphasiastrum complanatum]